MSLATTCSEKLNQLKEEVCRRALAQDRDLLHWEWQEHPDFAQLLHIPSQRIYAKVTTHFEGYRFVINAEFPTDFYRLEKM